MNIKQRPILTLLFIALFFFNANAQNGIVVLQTDFGLKDGAVSAMKGVAMQVDKKLQLFDLTHEIPAFNIWEAAFRLNQVVAYWPKGTVFVSVVDPGVGSERKPIVLQTKSGHYFVGPDNGTFTLVAARLGIKAIREIDEKRHRLPGSDSSYTFHGRDVFAYTAAKLASGKISFTQVGKLLPATVVMMPHQKPVYENGIVKGTITVLDVQYGNVWTNIDAPLLARAGIQLKDTVVVTIYFKGSPVYYGTMPFVHTFSDVAEQQVLGYLNSELKLSIAINMGSFASKHKIESGPDWKIEVGK
jgi:S-adenosylmethionine hydrolase